MRFSLIYEMQRPTLDDHALIEETIEQCILADEVGWDAVWFVEHHFLTGFSMSPCPEVMFGALSRLTKRIRLGFGVVILPYHHPVRVAEKVAFLDHMSKGRMEFGTGRSAAFEQVGMGIDPRDTRAMWEESLAMIPKIWESDTFEWEGRFWKVPPREVLPKPYQKPHPPIWTAANQPSTYQLAAQKGIGVMALGISDPAMMAPHIREYRENIKKAEPVGKFANNQWLSHTMAYCSENNKEARELCALSLKTFFGPDKPYVVGNRAVYQQLVEQWGGVPDHLQATVSRYLAEDRKDEEIQEDPGDVGALGGGVLAQRIWQNLDADTLADRGVGISGDPESCTRAAKLHEASGVDELQFLVATEVIPHEKAMKSIEMFAKYVIPEFRKTKEEAKVGS